MNSAKTCPRSELYAAAKHSPYGMLRDVLGEHRDNAPEPGGATSQVMGVGAFSPVPAARPFRPGPNGVQAGSLPGLELVPEKWRCLGPGCQPLHVKASRKD